MICRRAAPWARSSKDSCLLIVMGSKTMTCWQPVPLLTHTLCGHECPSRLAILVRPFVSITGSNPIASKSFRYIDNFTSWYRFVLVKEHSTAGTQAWCPFFSYKQSVTLLGSRLETHALSPSLLCFIIRLVSAMLRALVARLIIEYENEDSVFIMTCE